MERTLAVERLQKRYGSHVALERADLVVRPHEAWLLLGDNGAGKSTLLACLTGLRIPTAGSARIDGLPARTPRARATMGVLPEKCVLPGHHRVRTLVQSGGREVDPALSSTLRLPELLDRRVRTLSAGQHQRAALALALAGTPDWLVLDEPLTALDVRTAGAVVAYVGSRVEAGAAALIATHRPEAWRSIATHEARIELGLLAGPA
jgi:ABC-type multidrug transport system ATPase subunit